MSKSNGNNHSDEDQVAWEDLRITSYVLGELTQEQRTQFESELESNDQLQAAVQQARGITAQLEGLFAAEMTPPLDGIRRDSIVNEANGLPCEDLESNTNEIATGDSAEPKSRNLDSSDLKSSDLKSSDLKYRAPSWGTPLLIMATAAVLLFLVGIAPFLRQRATLTALESLNQFEIPVTAKTPATASGTAPATASGTAPATASGIAPAIAAEAIEKSKPVELAKTTDLTDSSITSTEIIDPEESTDVSGRVKKSQPTIALSPALRNMGMMDDDGVSARLNRAREAARKAEAAALSAQTDADAAKMPVGEIGSDEEANFSMDAMGMPSSSPPTKSPALGLPPLDSLKMDDRFLAKDLLRSAEADGDLMLDHQMSESIASAQERIRQELGPLDANEPTTKHDPGSSMRLVPDLGQITSKGAEKKRDNAALEMDEDVAPMEGSVSASNAPLAAADVAASRGGRRLPKAKQQSESHPKFDSLAEGEMQPAEDMLPTGDRRPGGETGTPLSRANKSSPKESRSAKAKSVDKKRGPASPNTRRALNSRALGREAMQRIAGEKIAGEEKDLAPGSFVGDQPRIDDNEFQRVAQQPVSTFAVDVDTASYSDVRNSIMRMGSLPSPDAVRIEEMLNYFNYSDEPHNPRAKHPIDAHIDVTECPWKPQHRLARIAINGKVINEANRPACNLVFMVDTSGSMDQPNKLPLLIEGMKTLTKKLDKDDRIAIAVYSGSAGTVLASTPANKKKKIGRALSDLSGRSDPATDGNAAGDEGIALAYRLAQESYIPKGINRVIVCTDGDFNVGVAGSDVTGTDALVRKVEGESKAGIFLSVLGFGMGNQNDALLERISGRANGSFASIETQAEAKKVLVDQTSVNTVTIAKDFRLQLEFNPNRVSQYRLIGYENGPLAKEGFDDDKTDADEIRLGHTITALYEIVPTDGKPVLAGRKVDGLKYQQAGELTDAAKSNELMTLKIRYKLPGADANAKVDFAVADDVQRFTAADVDVRFAAAVASFGMQLRQSEYAGAWTLSDVLQIARNAIGDDEYRLRAEFVKIVQRASELMGEQ